MSFTSITQRFAVWFLLISLLPVLLLGYSLLRTFETELQGAVSQQISGIADKKADQIDAYLNGRVHEAAVKIQSNTVRQAMQSFSSTFARKGGSSAEYRRLDDSYRDYFRRFVAASGFYDLFLISTQGTVVYSQAHEADFATNLFDGPYRDSGLAKVTHNALRTLESGISEFELYAPSGNAVAAFIAVPIMAQGKVIGVLALQVDNRRVFQVLLDATGLGESGETVVASREHEDGPVMMVPLKYDPDAEMRHKARMKNPLLAAPLLRALNGERGSGLTTDYRGEPVVAAWRYLPRMRWGMVVKMDTAEALAPYYRVRNFAIAALALAFLAALGAAIVLGRAISKPLIILNNIAHDVANGKFGRRVPALGRDELGQLAASFNTMAQRLQSSYANLEGQVSVRTAELTLALQQEKETKDALFLSESLFRTLAQVAPVGIFRTDAAGACTYVNEQYCAIAGRSSDQALGSGWASAIHPADRAPLLAEWERSITEHAPFLREFRFQHPDGKELWTVCQSRAEYGVHGDLLGYVGTVTDISERKQSEEMLRSSNDELERRVENRTSMLRAAKEEAEQANNSKSLFLTSMSHELRTPLNAILGYAQLMQMDDSLPPDVIENANEIRMAGDYLLSLMNDMLDLSRIESGQLQLEVESLALGNVMQSCHAQNLQAALTRNVTLHMAESCAIYRVMADRRGLAQVLNNLVSNAIKYNRAGGRVNVSCAESGQDKVRISVMDSGLGIAADKQSQLFQPFNRLGAEMGTIEGTGIGLVISRKLLEGMQGVIGFDSIAGLGSTFWIELPLAADARDSTPAAALTPLSTAASGKKPRVLVAEDYVPNQNVLMLQLQTMGCEVDIAPNGAAALSMWRENPYDLILTDIDMPVMNGTEFAQALRKEELGSGGHIPVIAITATIASSELKRYQYAGIDEVLSKPLSMDMLRNGMMRWLGEVAGKAAPTAVNVAEYAAESRAAGAVLDLNYLYHILGQVNLHQARVLVDTFMRTAEEGLLSLNSQMDDAAAVAKEMHKQKSSARTVGALRYAKLAAALEQRTKDEYFTGMASSLAAMREALDEVEAASANLLESSRVSPEEPLAANNTLVLNAQTVLVVDDDLVVLQQVKAMLGAHGMKEVYTAINGVEASTVLAERGDEIEVLICDLSMPQMDGVELIRQLKQTGFKGGLILISGADEKIISTVNKLAVLQGVRVLGQLQKPVSAAKLAILLAHTADLPALQRQAVSGPAVSREAILAAMEANEFSIWFQPKVDAVSLHAVGIEALARWRQPDGKFIPPDSFITVAEREGLIGDLSRLLVSISLSEAAKLFTAGFPLKVAINLSGTWLNDLTLPDFILSNTVSSGLRATDVILEVTETGVMEDLTTALDVLSRLRLKGFGLSIDDFGIGYSSFEQLGRIPFTEMKLDRSFVSKGVEDAAARAILESSMDMAHKLSLSTVAEGVETELDLKLVRSLGCDLVQGYLIAKPMPVKDLIAWLDNPNNNMNKKTVI